MTILFALFGGMAVGVFLMWRIDRAMFGRRSRHRRMERAAESRQKQRDTIESGRDTEPRRGDYVVSEGDLLGVIPGALTKDHLEDYERFSAKPVDLQPDWTRLSESGSDSDSTE